jgi:hypothetical protein
VKHKKRPDPAQASFVNKVASLWPALKGSLALVHKPCIRPGCPACASGNKHPAHLLAFSERGRRRCMYVPIALVPVMRRALKNGRKIEELLCKTGPALIQEHRASRTSIAPKERASRASKTPRKRKN